MPHLASIWLFIHKLSSGNQFGTHGRTTPISIVPFNEASGDKNGDTDFCTNEEDVVHKVGDPTEGMISPPPQKKMAEHSEEDDMYIYIVGNSTEGILTSPL